MLFCFQQSTYFADLFNVHLLKRQCTLPHWYSKKVIFTETGLHIAQVRTMIHWKYPKNIHPVIPDDHSRWPSSRFTETGFIGKPKAMIFGVERGRKVPQPTGHFETLKWITGFRIRRWASRFLHVLHVHSMPNIANLWFLAALTVPVDQFGARGIPCTYLYVQPDQSDLVQRHCSQSTGIPRTRRGRKSKRGKSENNTANIGLSPIR